MATRAVYELLADVFSQEEVSTCFALLGDANMNWASAMAGNGCRFIYVRHEHCAVSASMTWARATGEVGVATVTCGPGLTQILTALPAAARARIPLLVFAGEAPLKSAWYNQAIEQRPFVEACGAVYQQLHHPQRMPVQVRDAFLQARTERRPVVLGIPFDLQNEVCTSDTALPSPSKQLLPQVGAMPPNPKDIERLIPLLAQASKVIVMAGLGAASADAGDACRELARCLDGLLATTLPARGLFHDDPFYIGVAGGFSSEVAMECFAKADLVIAVGTSLASHNADSGRLFAAASVLQIDIAPHRLSQGREAAAWHLRSDALLGVSALIDALDQQRLARDSGWRSDSLAKRIATEPPDSAVFPLQANTHDPRDVVRALDTALPVDWELVNSSGHSSWFTSHMIRRPIERFHTIREFGAIGNGIAYAIGVAAARPGRPVVLFDGDGSLLMHIQELETIRRHKLNILICVLNDGAYGSEIHKLRAEGLPEQGAVFGRPPFASIASGFGISASHVTDLSELAGMIEQFAGDQAAAVWDFHISDQVVSPVMRRSHPPAT